MRILFIGAVEFSAWALRELIAMQADVVGVCTRTESAFNGDHFDLTQIAVSAGIPVRDTPNIHDPEVLEWIGERRADVIFCFGWSRLIHAPLLNMPRMGVIGFHPAALPANRGRHPLIWALVLGIPETASTFFFMDEGADSGDILSQITVNIDPSDDASSLYARVTKVAMTQIRDFLPRLADGSFQRQPQDHRMANVWRKRGVADGRIEWRMAATSIHNLVRGLARPYVGAHFDYEDQIIKVWRTKVVSDAPANIEPGKVLVADKFGVLVKAGIGAIRLCDFERTVALKCGVYL